MKDYGIGLLSFPLFAMAIAMGSCSRDVTVSVYNPTSTARIAQVVEIDASRIIDRVGRDFNVSDADGNQTIKYLWHYTFNLVNLHNCFYGKI